MDQTPPEFQDIGFPILKLQRRRQLLPWWIVAFTWLFMIALAIVPIVLIVGILGHKCYLALLGLSSNDPISPIGASIMLLFLFKGITAFALWTERVWAVRVAKIDAIVSIVICVAVMVYWFSQYAIDIRLELIALFPYYIKMTRIQYDWENFGTEEPFAPEVTSE